MLTDAERATFSALAEAEDASFADLVKLARLDPTRAFRGADLQAVNFGAADLAGYDFTEADLSNASLADASIKGAVFDRARTTGVRWPQQRVPPKGDTPPLTPMQHHAVEQMLRDLDGKNRAVALMPTGTGRGGVLEQVIVSTLDRHPSGMLIVNTAAERDQFARRLAARLGEDFVTVADRRWRSSTGYGLVVTNATYRDIGALRTDDLIEIFGRYSAIFTTSVDKVQQLARGGGGVLEHVHVATVDNSPIDADRPDRRRFAASVRKLFGGASFVIEVDEAVSLGLLKPVRIVVDPVLETAEVLRGTDIVRDDTWPIIQRLGERISEHFLSTSYPSMFILCRDDSQARMIEAIVKRDVARSRGLLVTRLGTRWGAARFPHEPGEIEGLIIAPESRQAMEMARRHPSVTVVAPLSVVRAQDLAYRPPSLTGAREAVIYDLVDAFSGFRDRDHSMS